MDHGAGGYCWQPAGDSSCPWTEWPEEMALKTAIRYAISRGLAELDEMGQIAYDHDATQERGDEVIETEEAPAIAAPAKPASPTLMLRMVLSTSPPCDIAGQPPPCTKSA